MWKSLNFSLANDNKNMSRYGITYANVVDAAQQLKAQGKNPTIELVRSILKSGSHGTIATHLRNWRLKEEGTQEIASKEKLPNEFIAVMRDLWEKLITQADEKIQGIKESADITIAELKLTLDTLGQESNQWQKKFHLMKQERDSFQQEKEALEKIISDNKIATATFTAQHEGVLQQLVEKQSRIAELHRLNQQTQANLEHYRETAREQRLHDQHLASENERSFEQTIQQLRTELKAQQQEGRVQQQAANNMYAKNEMLQAELDKQTAIYETVNTRSIHLEKELTEQRHWKNQAEVLQLQLEKQHEQFIDSQKNYAALNQKLITAETIINELTVQNRLLNHEKWDLGQEKAKLLGQLTQMEKIL